MRELNDVVKGISGPREAGGLVFGPWAYTGTTLGKQGQKLTDARKRDGRWRDL